MRAVIYARVSGEDRGSLQTQIDMGREYATRCGYTVAGEFSEEWVSGAAMDAPELQRLLELARNGGFDVLIVREMDRLARDLVKQMLVEEQLRKAGVKIEYILGEYPDTPEGTLNKQIRAVVAEFERQKITERSVRGRRASARAGNVLGGRAPYGYRFTDDHLQLKVVESEANVIRMIYDWYTLGNGDGTPLSSTQIAAKLTALHVPTWADLNGTVQKRAAFGEWGARAVLSIIHSQTYSGTFYYGRANCGNYNPEDTWIPVDVPAIVSVDMWATAQAQCSRNRTRPVHAVQHDYLLQGRLTCGECGGNVYAITDSHEAPKYWRYYRCGDKIKGRANCPLPGFRVDHLDAAAWEWITTLLLDRERIEAGLEAIRDNPRWDDSTERHYIELQGREVALNAQRERLLDLYLTGHMDKPAYLQRHTALAADLAAVTNELRAIETTGAQTEPPTDDDLQNAAAFAVAIADELEGADFATRRRIVAALDVRGVLFEGHHAEISMGLLKAWRCDIFINNTSYIPKRIRLHTTIELKRPR